MALVPGQALGGKWGALYVLRDAIIELQGTQALSTTAVATGATYGGAPVMRKVVAIPAGPNANSINVAHGIASLGTVLRVDAVLEDSGTSFTLPVVDTATAANGIRMSVTATNIALTSGANWAAYSGQAIIEYTVA